MIMNDKVNEESMKRFEEDLRAKINKSVTSVTVHRSINENTFEPMAVANVSLQIPFEAAADSKATFGLDEFYRLFGEAIITRVFNALNR